MLLLVLELELEVVAEEEEDEVIPDRRASVAASLAALASAISICCI